MHIYLCIFYPVSYIRLGAFFFLGVALYATILDLNQTIIKSMFLYLGQIA